MRAAYLCELNGAPIDAESNTAMPAEFLMQQMELREAVDDAVDAAAMDEIGRQSATLKREMLLKLEQQMDAQHDWPAAAQTVRALMFLDRLAGDIDRKRATLE